MSECHKHGPNYVEGCVPCERHGVVQVGGSHYKNRAIQPIDYIAQNGLNFMEGSIVKYATRHRDKGGAEDIRKIKQYCDFILKYEYGE